MSLFVILKIKLKYEIDFIPKIVKIEDKNKFSVYETNENKLPETSFRV